MNNEAAAYVPMVKNLALLTDLYELTMIQGYYFHDPGQQVVFEMFFRRQPFKGGFAIFAGLAPLVQAIEQIAFTNEDISYLRSLGLFKEEFLDYLAHFRFQGDLYAVREGSIVFPNEPLIRVSGNIIEAQLLESMLLNCINFQTLIATKTARIALAAGESSVLEFGLRRAHGIDGALSATRAAFIGGASATSNTLAGKLLDIPVKGTMAHSWVMSFSSELESFEQYSSLYPQNCILLVDTYDTLGCGVPNAIKVFKTLKEKGISNFGIRLDSGDLEYVSKKARAMLDSHNLEEARIIASNELDEWIIDELLKNKAPIDAWGVGTKLVTASDDSSLTGVYKIIAKEERGVIRSCIKISNNPEKVTTPGIKNICRFFDKEHMMLVDLVFLEEERAALTQKIAKKEAIRCNHPSIEYAHFVLEDYTDVTYLLEPIIVKGERVSAFPLLRELQMGTLHNLQSLDDTYKRLLNPHIYKISLSDNLKKEKYRLIKKIKKS